MTPIFVYGTLLSRHLMRQVTCSATPREPATLYEHQLEFRGGLATVDSTPAPHDKHVRGALYDVDVADIWMLDRYERYDPLHPETGLYDRVQKHVVHDDGTHELATVYVMLSSFARCSPNAETLAMIVRGYADWDIHVEYLAQALERAC